MSFFFPFLQPLQRLFSATAYALKNVLSECLCIHTWKRAEQGCWVLEEGEREGSKVLEKMVKGISVKNN